MRVEAIKVKNGFLIPFDEPFRNIKREKITLEVEIIDPDKLKEGYAILSELVGFCESERKDE